MPKYRLKIFAKYPGFWKPQRGAISEILTPPSFIRSIAIFNLYAFRYCKKLIPVTSLNSVDRWFSDSLIASAASERPIAFS